MSLPTYYNNQAYNTWSPKKHRYYIAMFCAAVLGAALVLLQLDFTSGLPLRDAPQQVFDMPQDLESVWANALKHSGLVRQLLSISQDFGDALRLTSAFNATRHSQNGAKRPKTLSLQTLRQTRPRIGLWSCQSYIFRNVS